jgi:serine/threonine protein kinase
VTVEGARPATNNLRPEIIADRYRVERELGHGGMATVYLCTDIQTESKVAIKVLKPELGTAVSVERFLREITFSSQLDHPQIPKVLGSGVIGQVPFYVMTYIEGESLRTRLDRAKQFTIDEAVRITREVIAPTAYAHRMGIIHRDIKPANILLAKDRVYVLDFGVARALAASADDSLTSTGVAVGTPAYMSPEQALAEDNLDARSDVYSLACVTYEMIAGLPPFVGATAQAVMARRFVSAPPPLSETRESVPESVETAVAKALCKAPADRWQSITEFGDALTAAPQSPSISATQVLLSSRRRRFAAAITAVAVLALAITGVVAWSLVDRDGVSKARRSLDSWDIPSAEAQLRKTISSSGTDAEAQLWMAQLLILENAPISEWDTLALRAADHKADLPATDTARATALALFANEEGNDRCSALRNVAAKPDRLHPDDYSAAITLADCLSTDRTVVKDSSTSTGYRFASSYQEAIGLYEGILARNANNGDAYRLLIPRLQRVLWTSKSGLRGGSLRGDASQNFIASPALVGDTVVFAPVLLAGNGAPLSSDVAGFDRLAAKNLEKLRKYATAWVRASPDDPDAQESLATALEFVGKIGGNGTTAISSIRAARLSLEQREEDKAAAFYDRFRLASTNVRLMLKLGQYHAARLLADSALAWDQPSALNDTISVHVDALRSGFFAITGRLQKTIDLDQKYATDYPVRIPSGETRKLPADIGSDAMKLIAYAEFGAPRDSIIAVDARIRSNLQSVIGAAQVADYERAILRRPLSECLDVTGTKLLASLGPSSDPFISAVRAVDAGQLGVARKLADSLAAFRSGTAAGEITMDVVLQEAWLRTAIGDSSGAAVLLDRALKGISRAPANLLEEAELGTALVRAMLMRANLAAKAGDTATQAVWLNAAKELWTNADPALKSMIAGAVRTN